jgi:peroxiredoxin Q/BCP
MLEVGADAPEFRVKSHAGQYVSMTDFLGRNVVLWFFPKADTPGCTAEGCGFRDRIAKFKEKNVAVLGVSFDDEADNRRFAMKYGFPFPLLCDTKREIGIPYGACLTETDPHAERIGYLIDTHGRIKQAYPRVDAKSFPEEVLKDL